MTGFLRTPCGRVRSHPGALALGLTLLAVVSSTGCVTVRPEQRALLADPTMSFAGEPGEKAAMEHVLENREASFGGGSVRGGGCGCN